MPFDPEQVKKLLLEQYASFTALNTGTPRESLESIACQIKAPHILVITGLRRSGKSTLLRQIATTYYQPDDFYFVNFDDDRFLNFEASEFNQLFELMMELFGERKIFFFDEVQNIPRWETYVRRLNDQGYKIYVTGSNASLLSKEFGSRLTGRHQSLELFPFSFKEFLDFKAVNYKQERGIWDTATTARLKKFLSEYMKLGGIPEALKYPEIPVLKRLYNDVLYRDIVSRFNIDADKTLRELAYFVFSNTSSPISFSKIKNSLGFGSVNTVKNYISFLETAWLAFELHSYNPSVRKQQVAAKKIYSIDLGLNNEIAFNFSARYGAYLENLIFLGLRREQQEFYYYKTNSGYEVDFYIPKTRTLIQACYEMSDADTRARELRALVEAKQELNAQNLIIISFDHKEEIKLDSTIIKAIPAYEFLLKQSN